MLIRVNNDGTYCANWTPGAIGLYTIHVTIDGIEIGILFLSYELLSANNQNQNCLNFSLSYIIDTWTGLITYLGLRFLLYNDSLNSAFKTSQNFVIIYGIIIALMTPSLRSLM